MSRAVHLLLGTVVSLLLLGYGSALVGNCSQVEAYYVYQESVGFQIHPLRIEAFPAYNGRRAAAIGVLWEPMVVMERNRTFYDMNGALIGSPQCVYPSGLLSDPYTDDPTSACNVGTTAPCGAILQSFLFTECDCTTHTGKDIFHGVERTTYSIEYTHQLYPDMRITFHAYLVNQSVLVYPFNDPTNPDAITWDYRLGRLKFGYDFLNFPWLHPNATVSTGYDLTTNRSLNNGTYFYGAYATSLIISQGTVEVSQSDHSVLWKFRSSNNSLELTVGVDTGSIVDGIPFNDPLTAFDTVIYNFTAAYLGVPDDPDLTYAISNGWSNLHVCDDYLGQWKNASFDPYLSALFIPDPTQPQSKSRKTAVIAAVVSVVLVLVLVGVILVLIFTVPSLKRLVFTPKSAPPKNREAKA